MPAVVSSSTFSLVFPCEPRVTHSTLSAWYLQPKCLEDISRYLETSDGAFDTFFFFLPSSLLPLLPDPPHLNKWHHHPHLGSSLLLLLTFHIWSSLHSLPAGYTYLCVTCHFHSCLLSMGSFPLLPCHGLSFSLNFHQSFLPTVARIILKLLQEIVTLLA